MKQDLKQNAKTTVGVETNETRDVTEASPADPREAVSLWLEPILTSQGYELVALELNLSREKKLRLFIDKLSIDKLTTDSTATSVTPSASELTPGTKTIKSDITIDDCMKVSQLLDQPLDENPLMETIFKGPFELEVSSPGIERPLRKLSDYTRFQGQRARIHLYRPLSGAELENETYATKNPKQKNFLGFLKGVANNKVGLMIPVGKNQTAEDVRIPLSLISKAHLDPESLDLSGLDMKGSTPV